MSLKQKPRRSAFTLVEMLVVIVIIAILAGLLLPAIGMVQKTVRTGAIATELSTLAQAVETYRNENGDYPPDFSNPEVVRRHILEVWPRISNDEMAIITSLDVVVDPAEALVFWLRGFSKDPKHPFTGVGGPFLVNNAGDVAANPERNNGPADLDKARLNYDDDGDMFPVLAPKGRNEPFVYFDGSHSVNNGDNSYIGGYYEHPDGAASRGVAQPYRSDRSDETWVNEGKFQIISAGLDGHYGAGDPASFPSGDGYLSPGDGDDDNITNFSEGGTLKDRKP